jgi:NAD(P)H-dependent flavin oxidoreductase YrpB (nitropropane dioxygenase family)
MCGLASIGSVVYENGDEDHGIWSAGIAMGIINDIPTCAELLSRFEREGEEIIRGRLMGLVGSGSRESKL